MTKFEKELLDLLDCIEIITSDNAVVALTQTRFDIAEEYGYTVEMDSEPMRLH